LELTARIGLAGKVGRLLDDVASGRIDGNRDALSAHLVEIFRSLIRAANDAGVREHAYPHGRPESTVCAMPDRRTVYELLKTLEILSAFDPSCADDNTSDRVILPHHLKLNRTRNTSAPRSFFATAAVSGFQMC
jgi:hypothetical protein